MYNKGTCPTGQHKTDFRQCGFAGCVDLQEWAKSHRFRFRLEQSYNAEINPHIKGDGRWFVEIVCYNGLIYPKGDTTLIAYANRGVKRHIAELTGVEHHQYDDDAEVFRFPAERLDEVAAILKPKRLPGSARLTAEHREKLKPYAFLPRQNKI